MPRYTRLNELVKLAIIWSDNNFSHVRRQANTWINDDYCWSENKEETSVTF